ncbi:MAG: TetR/AcrR family transcriptional regulator [Bacteroidales bacterium]
MTKLDDKKEQSHSDMRDSIVGIASEIFARFGFKKTTVDDIAQALRKGKSSIYYYFNSKEDIFQAVVDSEADALREKINAILAKPISAMEKLRQYVKTRMQAVQVMVNYYALINEKDVYNLKLAEKLRSKYDTEEVEIIKRILNEGASAGAFKIKDLELSAIAVITAMKGLEMPLLINSPKADDLESVLDDLLDILFYGIVIRNE